MKNALPLAALAAAALASGPALAGVVTNAPTGLKPGIILPAWVSAPIQPIEPSPVPEPPSIAVLALVVAALLAFRRRD